MAGARGTDATTGEWPRRTGGPDSPDENADRDEARRLALKLAIGKGVAQVVAAYEPAMDAANALVLRRNWEQVMLDKPWLTDGVLATAVGWVLEFCKDERKVPPPAQLLQVCKDVRAEDERRAAREEARLLPAPPPALAYGTDFGLSKAPPGVDQEFWLRNIAIGKARARKRNAAADAWLAAQEGSPRYGFVPAAVLKDPAHEPTEEEIAAMTEEIETAGISGQGRREVQAERAGEQTRRALAKEQVLRELQKTAKGRAFLKETTYDELVQAELRHFTEGR